MTAGRRRLSTVPLVIVTVAALAVVGGLVVMRPGVGDARELSFPLSMEYETAEHDHSSGTIREGRFRWEAADWDHWSRFVVGDPTLSDSSSRERELHLDRTSGVVRVVWPDGTDELTEAPDGPMAAHPLLRPTLSDGGFQHGFVAGTEPDDTAAERVASALRLASHVVEGRRWEAQGDCRLLRTVECEAGDSREGAISGVFVYHAGLLLPLLVEERLDGDLVRRLEVTSIDIGADGQTR